MRNFLTFFCLFFSLLFSKEPIEDFLKPHPFENTNSYQNPSLIEKIYVVNLDKAKNRWSYMQGLFSRFNIQAERFSAVNGWEIPRHSLKFFVKNCLYPWKYKFHINPGRIGVFLSHLSIFKNALERNFEIIWILEDDVCFDINPLPILDEQIRKLQMIDPDWEVLFTDTTSRNKNPDGSITIWNFENNFGKNFDYSLIESDDFVPYKDEEIQRIQHRLGSYSMILSKKGIENFYAHFINNKMRYAYDVDYNIRANKHMYQMTYDLVTTYGEFGSSSEHNPN